jgi:hypothetical protein
VRLSGLLGYLAACCVGHRKCQIFARQNSGFLIEPKFRDGYVLFEERTLHKLTVPVVQLGKVEMWCNLLICFYLDECPFFQIMVVDLRAIGKQGAE